MGLVWWEPCLWGFAALVGSSGPGVYYGDLQLWLAVLGLVWWEPCLWGFAALVGSDGPRLVWREPCLGICSFGRQFWVGIGPRLAGTVSMGICGSDGPRLVGAVSMGICSFRRQ